MKKKITDNLKRIKDNITEACLRRNRRPEEVRLIVVTKLVEVDTIRLLLEMGQIDIGESRVQQLMQRSAMITESINRQQGLMGMEGGVVINPPLWHMIGHLQRNKVRSILPLVEYIHSVDSLRLAEEINLSAAKLGLTGKVKILLEVNTSQEKKKSGLAVGAVTSLAEQLLTLHNIEIVGLMTMAPLTDEQEICRSCFTRLREIFEEMRGEKIIGPAFKHLSMGMSQDYITGVEEGATMVRIGSAIFQ